MKKTLVAGLGNPLMQDDGIGVKIIARLDDIIEKKEDLDILDMGVTSIDILARAEDYFRIILIDAMAMGDSPGKIKFYKDITKDSLNDISAYARDAHGVNLSNTIKLIIQMYPELKLYVIGIQPYSVDMGTELSEPLKKNFDDILKKVKEFIIQLTNNN